MKKKANLLFSLGGFKKETILIWSKEENEQVWDSEKGTVGTVCDGYRMWGWREEARCAFITSSATYKTTPLGFISRSCLSTLSKSCTTVFSYVSFGLHGGQVCMCVRSRCSSVLSIRDWSRLPSIIRGLIRLRFQCPFGMFPRQQTDTGYLTIILSKILWAEKKCVCSPEVYSLNV